MGLISRHLRHDPSSDPIPASDLYDMGITGGGQSFHTDDVHTDSRELCLGGQSVGTVGVGWVEHVGDICGDGGVAGVFVGYGDYV